MIEERQKVIEALLGKNCFPVGMEYFPAANADQFTVIKKLIDRCDSWKEPYELAFKVNKSLDYLFENDPRIGWVKAIKK